MRAFCDSLTANCCKSCLSRSESLERSTCGPAASMMCALLFLGRVKIGYVKFMAMVW